MTAIPELSQRDPLTDAEIVRRVLAGETSLFELIMRRYNQRVYRAVRAIVRDESEAEDVMQQAYVNAFSHLGQFAERSAFSTWLTRIAINEALARIRPRALQLVSDEVMSEIESPSPNPEEAAMTSESKRWSSRRSPRCPTRIAPYSCCARWKASRRSRPPNVSASAKTS